MSHYSCSVTLQHDNTNSTGLYFNIIISKEENDIIVYDSLSNKKSMLLWNPKKLSNGGNGIKKDDCKNTWQCGDT